jgi:hypothetical protein
MSTKRQAPDAGRLAEIEAWIDKVPSLGRDDAQWLLALARRQREMLARLEKGDPRWPFCPICHLIESRGHAADCQLAALLHEFAGTAES